MLLTFAEIQATEMLHVETQRSAFAGLFITIALSIGGEVISNDFVPDMKYLSMPLIVLGVFGALVSEELYDDWRVDDEHYKQLRKRLDVLNPEAQAERCRELAVEEHKKHRTLRIMMRVRLHYLWEFVHVFIAVFGLVLTIIILNRQ